MAGVLGAAGFAVHAADPAPAPTMRKLALGNATVGAAYTTNVKDSWGCSTNASPTFQFTWQTPNAVPGLTFASSGQISGTPTSAGTYTLGVAVTDVSGRQGACTGIATTTYTLLILAAPPVCTIGKTPAGVVSAGTPVSLVATCTNSPTVYDWSSNGVSFGTARTVVVSPAQTTLYTVAASNGVGSGAKSVQVEVAARPPVCTIGRTPVGAIGPGTKVVLTANCEGAPTTYAWSAGGATLATGHELTTGPIATTTYAVVATGPGGASIPAQTTVAVRTGPPAACRITASPAALPAGGGTVQLAATCAEGGAAAANGYAWSGTGTAGKATATITTSVSATSSFSVTASNASGASGTAQVTVPVGVAVPAGCTITSSPPTLPPGGGPVKLTVACNAGGSPSGTGYRWSGLTEYAAGASPSTATVATHLTGTTTVAVKVSNDGGDASLVEATIPVDSAPPPPNYQGIWWNAPAGSESGWGINLAHQGDVIFATWFTYDFDGTALWLAAVLEKKAPNLYIGALFRTTGPSFLAVPFDPSKVQEATIGTASLGFGDASSGTFAYTIGNVQRVKPITRQIFATPVPTCTWGPQPNLAAATNYQDLWWASPAGSESGWGINLNHQGATIFATWYTYDANNVAYWFVAVLTRTAPKTYEGAIYGATGPSYAAQPFSPANVQEIEIGTARFTFDDGANGTFEYTVLGNAGVKKITRFNFSAPGTATVCTPTEKITACSVAVKTGFRGDPNATYRNEPGAGADPGISGDGGGFGGGDGGAGGGDSGGADGGGAGAGAGEGKVLGGLLTVTRLSDGAALGAAITDNVDGMVTISSCEADLPVLLTIAGLPNAIYYDEGTGQYAPFGPGKVLHALVDKFDENIGVSAMTEAAYRYALNNFAASPAAVAGGAVGLKATGGLAGLTLAQVRLANAAVLGEVNRALAGDSKLVTIKSLPTPVDNSSSSKAFPKNRYGLAATVTGGFAKAAAHAQPASTTPALAWTEQLARDLTDGKLDGFALDGTPAAAGSSQTYDAVRFPVAMGTGMYAVAKRFGADTTFQLGPGLSDVKTYVAKSGDCITQSDLVGLSGDGTVNVLRTTPRPGISCYTSAADSTSTLLRGFATGVKLIATTTTNGYVVKIDGTVWTWGDGYCGLLGNGTGGGSAALPVKVTGLTNVTSIVGAAGRAVIARDARGFVHSWGSDVDGLLGTGGVTDTQCFEPFLGFPVLTASSYVPRRITSLANIVSVAVGADGRQAFAVDDKGKVYAWGRLVAGQTPVSSPVAVTGLSSIVSVTSDAHATYALRSDGTVWRIDFGTGPRKIAGLAGVVALAGGFALKNDGTVFDIGSGFFVGSGGGLGVLGDATPDKLPTFRHVDRLPHAGGTVNAFAGDNAFVTIKGGTPPGTCPPGSVCLSAADPGSPPEVEAISTSGLK